MSCCAANGLDKFFSRTAKRYAKRFRKKGLDNAQKRILEGVKLVGIDQSHVLEIGCGVGGLHLTMLREGARSAFGVDVSAGMLEQAKGLASELGFAHRTEYRQGDFAAERDASISNADIVVLDKVVCCYADPDALIKKSAEKAGKVYAVSYPRDWFLARMMFKTSAWIGTVLRWSFHPFYHEPEWIEKTISECGFQLVYSGATPIWQVRVFTRRQGLTGRPVESPAGLAFSE